MFKTKKLIYLALLAIVVSSCKESYPSIEEALPSNPEDVVPTQGQVDKVPIMPSLNDPQFTIQTRAQGGSGVFESWETDAKHWLEAIFHVFAYSTPNKFDGTAADMRETTDHQTDPNLNPGTSTLLFDRIMKITNRQGDVRFHRSENSEDDAKFYYPINEQRKKYNFFAYYADNAKDGQLDCQKDKVTMKVKIDGYQDIMHSFAYHTNDEFQHWVQEASKTLSGDNLAVITGGGAENLLYSTLAGHRGLNPIFHINHLMSKFNIYVQGAGNEESGAGGGDYRNVVVTGVTVESPTRGTLTVAADGWTEQRYKQAVANGEVLTWNTEEKTELHMNIYTDSLQGKMRSLYNEPEWRRIGLKTGQAHYNLKDKNSHLLGKPMVLPSVREFTFTLHSVYMNLHKNEDGSYGFLKDHPLVMQASPYVVALDETKYPNGFEAGKEYSIIIYVYGNQTISIRALLQNEWQPVDDPIEVGKDPD